MHQDTKTISANDLEESILDEDNVSDQDGEEKAPDQQQEEPLTDSTLQASVTEQYCLEILGLGHS